MRSRKLKTFLKKCFKKWQKKLSNTGAERMSIKNFIKNLVSNKIYRRGINYYNQGRVLQYRINKLEPNLYQISAQVSGTKKYKVNSEIRLRQKSLEFESSCECPYDWEEFCKHEVAVLHK